MLCNTVLFLVTEMVYYIQQISHALKTRSKKNTRILTDVISSTFSDRKVLTVSLV